MRGINANIAAEVREAEAVITEDQLIERVQRALSECNWDIGRYASEWTERFARGRTDDDFGALVGLSRDQVCQRRLVWDRWGEKCDTYHNLKFSHFYAALNWDDADTCLQWAAELGATVAEMNAWRRAQRGEDLTQPGEDESQPVAEEGESREGGRAPERVNRNASQTIRGGTGRTSGETRDPVDAAPPAVPAGKKRAAPPNDSEPPNSSTPAPVADQSPEARKMVPVADAPRPLSASEALVRLRTLLKQAQKDLPPEDLAEIGDECRSWANRLAPVAEDSGKFKAPRNPAERLAFIEQVRAYCVERKNGIDPVAFVDYHAAQGWKLSNGNTLKDWKAAIHTWERRAGPRGQAGGGAREQLARELRGDA